jgi:hypothetical protein
MQMPFFAEWDEDMISQTLVEATTDVQKHVEANQVSEQSAEPAYGDLFQKAEEEE